MKVGPDDQKAWEWMQAEAQRQGVRFTSLSPAKIYALTRMVPCAIRCWRVGVRGDIVNGVCNECGRPSDYTVWDKLTESDPETPGPAGSSE